MLNSHYELALTSSLKQENIMSGYRLIRLICLIAVTVLICRTGIGRADYGYIDISNPFLRKIPIAIPLFKPFSGSLEEDQTSVRASGLLAEALEFTGYFKMLDRESFLFDHRKSGIVIPDINFRNWTGIGSELLVTGGILMQDRMIQIELRLYDVFKEKLLVGKRYKGTTEDLRIIVHRFCRDVLIKLTGDPGVFDTQIAFVSTVAGNKEIFISEFDGYRPKRITYNNSISLFPAWSSDSKWIAFTSYARGNPDLYIKHLTEKRGAVVARKGINITPEWVPGQFSLAAALSFSGDPEIYLLTGSGKIIKRLTRARGIDSSPSFSPDGKKMAFVSKRSGKPQIHIMDMGSGQVERLTYEGKYNTQPDWSPAGDKIAYTAMEKGLINIMVIKADGNSDPIQLTFDSRDNESPSWSPDGSLIAFSSTREGPSRIYVMTAYGTDQRRLLALPGSQTNPAWSSRVVNK